MKIGVFDSGIGGLTVLKEIIKKYPNQEYYYFGDNKNAPYGSKTKKELLKLSNKIITFLQNKNVDIIVIACGTISSTIYKDIKTSIPVYNIIFPTISYLNESNFNNIGIIATDNTIKSNVFQKQLQKKVITQPCPSLVPLIERGEDTSKVLIDYLKPFKNKIDALILGCTHYPILEKEINKFFENKVKLINMGTILTNTLNLQYKKQLKVRMYFSKIDHTLIENIDRIIDFDYSLEEVVLEEL